MAPFVTNFEFVYNLFIRLYSFQSVSLALNQLFVLQQNSRLESGMNSSRHKVVECMLDGSGTFGLLTAYPTHIQRQMLDVRRNRGRWICIASTPSAQC